MEEGLGVFEEADIVPRNGLDKVFGRRKLAKGDAEMVCIIEGIEEIFVEGMYILQTGKAIEDKGDFFREGLLCVFDFACVEASYSTDFESRSDLGGKTSLGAAQHYIQKLLACRHWLYVFPSSLHGRNGVVHLLSSGGMSCGEGKEFRSKKSRLVNLRGHLGSICQKEKKDF